jgi:hypothetical protein
MAKCPKAENCVHFDNNNYSCVVKQDFDIYCFWTKEDEEEQENEEI